MPISMEEVTSLASQGKKVYCAKVGKRNTLGDLEVSIVLEQWAVGPRGLAQIPVYPTFQRLALARCPPLGGECLVLHTTDRRGHEWTTRRP
jgi:hypothetical protein